MAARIGVRRREHLKPAPGRIAVPRSLAVISLVAGVLLLGVAATKAADLIKDSWRKKIEVARLETEVRIGTALLDLERDMPPRPIPGPRSASSGRTKPWTREDRASAAFELEKSGLDLEEAGDPGRPRETSSTLPWSAAAISSVKDSKSGRSPPGRLALKESASNGKSRSGWTGPPSEERPGRIQEVDRASGPVRSRTSKEPS